MKLIRGGAKDTHTTHTDTGTDTQHTQQENEEVFEGNKIAYGLERGGGGEPKRKRKSPPQTNLME